MSKILESNRAKNCGIFDLIRNTSDLAYRVSSWHDTMKIESENLVENLRDNKIFNNDKFENNSEVEKVGRKNSVNWNHTKSILNWD